MVNDEEHMQSFDRKYKFYHLLTVLWYTYQSNHHFKEFIIHNRWIGLKKNYHAYSSHLLKEHDVFSIKL